MFKYNYLLKEYNIVHVYDEDKNNVIRHIVVLHLYNGNKIDFIYEQSDIKGVFDKIDNKLLEVFISLRIEKINRIKNGLLEKI